MLLIDATLLKNALANVIRGGASATVALALPYFLTRSLSIDRFAAWTLMLQLAAFASDLDCGLQTAVARYLAQAIERGEADTRNRLISTAFFMLSAAGVLALLATGAALIAMPHLFRQIHAPLLGEVRAGGAVLAASAALLLPCSTFTGVLIGLHRNEYPALAIGGSRIAGALLVITCSRWTHSLVVLASCIALSNIAGAVVQIAISWRLLPQLTIAFTTCSHTMARELAGFCSTLTVWSLSGLLVSGLDVTIVSHYDFANVGSYSLAALLTTFLAGINGSVCTALLAPMAVMQQRAQVGELRRVTAILTRLSSYTNIFAVTITFLAGEWILRMWVGDVYAAHTLPLLKVLMVANAARLVANPLATALIATGQQKTGLLGGLCEGISNFASSVACARWSGAIGVACGTLIGAVVSLTFVATYTLGRLRTPLLLRRDLLLEGVARPVICFLPLTMYAAIRHMTHTPLLQDLVAITAVVSTVGLISACERVATPVPLACMTRLVD